MVVPQFGFSSHGWDLHFFRNLRDRELENLANLTVILDRVHLNEELTDLRIWLPENFGYFSSKSAFGALQKLDGLQDFPFYGYIWKSGIPARIKFFAWSLSLGRVNTYDVLQRKRPFQCLFPNWCVMCKRELESSTHLFLQCEFAKSLWLKVWREFGLALVTLDNILDLLKVCTHARWNKLVRALWVLVVRAVLWGIWKERNSRIFSDEFVSAFTLWDKIHYWVAIWAKSRQDFRDIPLTDLYMGWSFLL